MDSIATFEKNFAKVVSRPTPEEMGLPLVLPAGPTYLPTEGRQARRVGLTYLSTPPGFRVQNQNPENGSSEMSWHKLEQPKKIVKT